MPDLPQTIVLPSAEALESPPALVDWGRKLIGAISLSWSDSIRVINSLSRVGTEANRTTDPDLDHIFYTANDGEQQTAIAVDGAWRGVRPTLQTVATASLPAANASRNGVVLIEQAGANDHNLIIYAGGNRYRVDGGSPF